MTGLQGLQYPFLGFTKLWKTPCKYLLRRRLGRSKTCYTKGLFETSSKRLRKQEMFAGL